MKLPRFPIVCVALLGVGVVILSANRISVGLQWDIVYRGDMVYAADIAAQYVSLRAEHGGWPKPEEIMSRLRFRDSSTRGTVRIDRYDCGPCGAYTLSVRLLPNGKVRFDCLNAGTKSP